MDDLISRQAALEQPDVPGTGYVGIEDDYPVSVKQVLNITAETGAVTTQERVRKLPRYKMQESCEDAIGEQNHRMRMTSDGCKRNSGSHKNADRRN